MAFRDNWTRHLFAQINGLAFDDSLARDFWRRDEDLWRAEPSVPWRWIKLFFVYFMSGVVQIVVPLTVVGSIYLPVTGRPWISLLIGIGIGVGFTLLGSVLGATWSCVEVSKRIPD